MKPEPCDPRYGETGIAMLIAVALTLLICCLSGCGIDINRTPSGNHHVSIGLDVWLMLGWLALCYAAGRWRR